MIPIVFKIDTRNENIESEASDIIWEEWENFLFISNYLTFSDEQLKKGIASGEVNEKLTQRVNELKAVCINCHEMYLNEPKIK